MLKSTRVLCNSSATTTTSIATLASPSGVLEHKDSYRFTEFADLRWTSAELNKYSRALAAGLLDARVRPGDTVLSMFGNESEAPLSFIATTLAGASTCFVDPSTTDVDALDRALIATEARAAFFRGRDDDGTDGASLWYSLLPKLENWPNGLAFRFSRYPNLKGLFYNTLESLAGMHQMSAMFIEHPMPDPLRKTVAAINPEDVVASSFDGQTLRSFSHQGMLAAGKNFASGVLLSSTDRILVDAPVSSPTGQSISTVACMSSAALQISAAAQFNAERSLSAIDDEFVTTVIGTPETISELLEKKSESHGTKNTLSKVIVVSDHDTDSFLDVPKIQSVFPSVNSVHVALTHPEVIGPLYLSGNLLSSSTSATKQTDDLDSRINTWATPKLQKKIHDLPKAQ